MVKNSVAKSVAIVKRKKKAKSVAIVKRKKKGHNKSKSLDQGRLVVPTAAWGAMRKPLIFVARVHGGSSCSPAVALGFESASDGAAVCVTCPTTYQRWKLPKTSVQAHQGVFADGVRKRAKRYLERISKPSEISADRVCVVCIVCCAGQIGLGAGLGFTFFGKVPKNDTSIGRGVDSSPHLFS